VEKLTRRKPRAEGHAPRRARTTASGTDADILAVQNHLEEFLGLSIRITADADMASGTVAIRYQTLDQLDLICQRLTGGNI